MLTLQANSTFLPLLDDLLSPDFRPVLQTPTTDPRTELKPQLDQAAAKIQHWWRHKEPKLESEAVSKAKHEVRHFRTEEHVMHLENQIEQLKRTLATERKMRSLQLEAIRSLWAQVQKMSTSDVMSQSMPSGCTTVDGLGSNGGHSAGGGDHGLSSSSHALAAAARTAVTCTTCPCSAEINLLRETLQKELSQIRQMINPAQRPVSLNLKHDGHGDQGVLGYASQMASKVLEDGVDEAEDV